MDELQEMVPTKVDCANWRQKEFEEAGEEREDRVVDSKGSVAVVLERLNGDSQDYLLNDLNSIKFVLN